MALGFMRRHRRWLFGFLWLVILAFIILYIPAFTRDDEQGLALTVAQVGGQKITLGEYQRSYQRQRQMYQSMYQGRMNDEMLRRLGLEEQALQGLVDERILGLEAERLGIRVDDETLKQRLATAPEFQQGGRFLGAAEIKKRLERQGVSVKEFEDSFRSSLLRERLVALVTDSVRVSPAEAEREFRRRNEQVKAEYVVVPADNAGITATDEEARARFDSNKDGYRLPERRVLSYVMADVPALASRVTLTDRDLLAYYEAHRDEFQQAEELCAAHLLIKVKATPDAKEGHADAEARRIAQSALDEIRLGADFAAVAKRVSEDQGSAAQGGDLGCFPRGRMVPEFDNAAFALGAGEISGVVRTNFGYHVIKAVSRKDESVPPFAQVKDPIRQRVMGERAQALVQEKSDALAAALRGGRSLEEAAREQGFTVQKSAPLARGDVQPPLASPPLLARAFELKKGEAAHDPLPVANGYAFIAVEEIQPARMPELKDVQDKVRADVIGEKAFAKARGIAADLRARAERDGLDKAASALGLARKQTDALVPRGQTLGDLGATAAVETTVFALPVGGLSEPVRTPAGWAVVRVLEKKDYDPAAFEKEKTALTAGLVEERRGQLFRAYMQEARKRFPVLRRPDALRRVVAS
jgi:peptidyl-prolyl cis-trans isomerase D